MSALIGNVGWVEGAIDRALFLRTLDKLTLSSPKHLETQVSDCLAMALILDAPLTQRSAGRPITTGKVSFVGDARLYNRNKVVEKLCLSPDEESLCSDSELLFKLFLEIGAQCLTYINGDFAFAIYNHRHRTVQLFRDHIGTRPVFWARKGEQLLFATFCDHLCALRNEPINLNTKRIVDYLYTPHDPSDESFVSGVRMLAPGCAVTITRDATHQHRWWDPRSFLMDESWTQQEAQETLRQLLSEAVISRLPEAGPIGAHLSGGIDSSLVSAEAFDLIAKDSNRAALAYTWSPRISERYPALGRHDERHRIESLCRPNEVPIRYGEAQAQAQALEEILHEPMEYQGIADLASELVTSKDIERDGVRVVLSGWGGDELISASGLGYLAWLLRTKKWGESINVLRRQAGGLRRFRRLSNYLWTQGIVPNLTDALYRHFSPFINLYEFGAFPSKAISDLYNETSVNHQRSPIRLIPDPMRYVHQLLLRNHLGERMSTWASWSYARGYEYRYPLTDRLLMEHLLQLPPQIMFGDGQSRFLVRKTFSDRLLPHTGKNEVAHDQSRVDARKKWLSDLQAGVDNGRLDIDCPYLDISALKAAIAMPIPANSLAEIRHFANIFVAMRVFEMYRRRG